MTTLTLAASNVPGSRFVDVLVEDFELDADRLTVWRTVKGRQFKVRGLVDIATSSGVATGRDFEAPFGVEASYRVEYFDADGERLGYSDPETVTLANPPEGVASFHNPLDPTSTVEVQLLQGAVNEIVRGIDSERFRIPGRSVGLAVFSGARRGVERVALDCYVDTFEDADRFDALFGGYDDDTIPILCVRTRPELRLPPTLFALVTEPRQVPFDNMHGGETVLFRLEGDEVAPPPEAFVVALLDYADFTAFYPDYSSFTSAYADYTEASRDYSIAGFGD